MMKYLIVYFHAMLDVGVIAFILYFYMYFVHDVSPPPPGMLGLWVAVFALIQIYKRDAGL